VCAIELMSAPSTPVILVTVIGLTDLERGCFKISRFVTDMEEYILLGLCARCIFPNIVV